MGRMIDDSVKQKLLDSLAKEPTMVLSTAYAYAKNYVKYGEDITKEWTTAVQQASILEQVRQKAWVEAYDSFKKEYENRLKADLVAMLTDMLIDVEEIASREQWCDYANDNCISRYDVEDLIQKKIKALKENIDGTTSN